MATQTDNVPANWAKEAVAWCIKNKILFGDDKGDLKLREPCTREMMAVFLYRYKTNITDKGL